MPHKNVESRILCRLTQGDLTGAIRRVVVDDQHLQVWCNSQNTLNQVANILAFVVGC